MFKRLRNTLAKYTKFIGPGIMVSIAYMVCRSLGLIKMLGSRKLLDRRFGRRTIPIQASVSHLVIQHICMFPTSFSL